MVRRSPIPQEAHAAALLVARDGRITRALLLSRGHAVTHIPTLRPTGARYPTVAIELDTHDLRFVERLGFPLTAAWQLLVPGGRLMLVLPPAVGLPIDEIRALLVESGFGPVLTTEGPEDTVLILAARSTEAPERSSHPGGIGGRPTLI